MQFCALSTVKQRITLGVPLPFNVRDNDQTLLLARGQVITTMSQLNELFERGALVDMDELRRPGGSDILEAPAETLPAMWGKCADRLTLVLRDPSQADFIAALDEASKPVLSLIERDPDLAISRSCARTRAACATAQRIPCTRRSSAIWRRSAWAGTVSASSCCNAPR